MVAIQSNHGVWLPQGQKVRSNRWRPYNRIFSDGKQEKRYIREIVFGNRRDVQYWQVTTEERNFTGKFDLVYHHPCSQYSV